MAKYRKGQSGNPKGRLKGVVDRRSRYLALIEQHMPDVVSQVVSAALGGNGLPRGATEAQYAVRKAEAWSQGVCFDSPK